MAGGGTVFSDKQTPGTFLTRWLDDVVALSRCPKTIATYEQLIRLYIVPAIGDLPLQRLTAQLSRRSSLASLVPAGPATPCAWFARCCVRRSTRPLPTGSSSAIRRRAPGPHIARNGHIDR